VTPVEQILERLERLYAIGGGEGANRPAYSPAEDEAHALVAGWMEETGLAVERDGAGNLVGRLRGERPELPEVWTGSHVDSVPSGGRFDGALGVVAGIDAVARSGRGERTLGVVVFRGEEVGCLGSRALCDEGRGLPGTFVELHVEQGPRLALADAPLGVVTSIVGYARREVRFVGRAGHAGTTPMDARDDALVRAAEYVLRVRDSALGVEGSVATVGKLEVEPGGVNVIPGGVTLTVDVRAPDDERLDALLAALDLEAQPRTPAVQLDGKVRRVLREEAERAGAAAVELPSGAGHDAGILAAAGVASGMLFVRSLAGGISHHPDEESSPDDIALAVDVLAATLARLASG
jgi:acetylornithine deacetylase/succinyl-diaminopimelate desuccinylase-like protein